MTYEEAAQRNLRNKVDAQLVQYMEQIVEYHQELDLMEDGELIDTAAEKMFLAEQEGEPIDTIEALRQAYEDMRCLKQSVRTDALQRSLVGLARFLLYECGVNQVILSLLRTIVSHLFLK